MNSSFKFRNWIGTLGAIYSPINTCARSEPYPEESPKGILLPVVLYLQNSMKSVYYNQ
jgi:hypothetical protein